MNQIVITHSTTNFTYQLTAQQVAVFEREISRTVWWKSLSSIINFILGRDKYVSPEIAIDATITVTSPSGRSKEWNIYGRTVLESANSKRKRQFYMGIFLLELVNF